MTCLWEAGQMIRKPGFFSVTELKSFMGWAKPAPFSLRHRNTKRTHCASAVCETSWSPAGCQTFQAFTASVSSHVVQFAPDIKGRRVTLFLVFVSSNNYRFQRGNSPNLCDDFLVDLQQSRNKPPQINQNRTMHHSGRVGKSPRQSRQGLPALCG